jgi:hypothetical protein
VKRPKELRDIDTVLDAFHDVVAQRDAATKSSAAYDMLAQRAISLAWVLNHAEVEEVTLNEDAFRILDCVG